MDTKQTHEAQGLGGNAFRTDFIGDVPLTFTQLMKGKSKEEENERRKEEDGKILSPGFTRQTRLQDGFK